MSEHHPDRTDLEHYARCEVASAEERWIEDHLRSGCTLCQRQVDELLPGRGEGWQPPPSPPPGSVPAPGTEDEVAFSRVLSKVEERRAQIEEERAGAPRLVSELMRRPLSERLALLRAGTRFNTLAVCELLIDESSQAGAADPPAANELAELALQVVERLDGRYYGTSVVQDMRARAWAYLGNARRLHGNLAGAEKALNIAERLVELGSADPLEEARILDLRASLLSDQGWLEEAADLLDSVIDIYEDVRDLHAKGRALISKGTFLGSAGFPDEAIELIAEGLSLLDDAEPAQVRLGRHQLILFLNDCGRSKEALRQLESFRSSYPELQDPATEIRLIWLEGRTAAGLGRFAQAELALLEARRRLLDLGMGYDAALVMLDLAGIYLEQGRRDEVRRLVEDMLPLFMVQNLHRHALAALIAFQQAVEGNDVTPARVQEIASYLQRARKNPRLCYRNQAA
jgi:tetratricopeptide (TPR) repeat protein